MFDVVGFLNIIDWLILVSGNLKNLWKIKGTVTLKECFWFFWKRFFVKVQKEETTQGLVLKGKRMWKKEKLLFS